MLVAQPFEKDVDGKVIMGLFGGDSKGATDGLAKEVAKDARNRPYPGCSSARPYLAPPPKAMAW
jgi:hypothetical protein